MSPRSAGKDYGSYGSCRLVDFEANLELGW
jgi:hypothetical protein